MFYKLFKNILNIENLLFLWYKTCFVYIKLDVNNEHFFPNKHIFLIHNYTFLKCVRTGACSMCTDWHKYLKVVIKIRHSSHKYRTCFKFYVFRRSVIYFKEVFLSTLTRHTRNSTVFILYSNIARTRTQDQWVARNGLPPKNRKSKVWDSFWKRTFM